MKIPLSNRLLACCGYVKPGDRVALEIDHPGQYCVIQFEDTMPEALVYVVKREINFHIPFGEQALSLIHISEPTRH